MQIQQKTSVETGTMHTMVYMLEIMFTMHFYIANLCRLFNFQKVLCAIYMYNCYAISMSRFLSIGTVTVSVL